MTVGRSAKHPASHYLKLRIIEVLKNTDGLSCRAICSALLEIKFDFRNRVLTNKNIPTTRAMHQLLLRDIRFYCRKDKSTKVNVWRVRGEYK